MSGSSKRLWTPRLTFEGAHKEALQFLMRCREKNVLVDRPAALYHAYRLDAAWPTEGMVELSRYLAFSNRDTPDVDRARDAVVRLLCVALKAHFFLDAEAIVRHEPYVFFTPDLFRPGEFRHGLVYTLEHEHRPFSLVVSEWDLTLAASLQPKVKPGDRFPVVLRQDSYKWLETKRWRELKELAADQPWLENRTWGKQRSLMDQVNAWTEVGTFPFGTLLTYDRAIKDEVAATGAEWARGVKHWFLPKGWDVEAVKEYLNRVATLTDEQRYQQRWWQRIPSPVRAVPTRSNASATPTNGVA